MQGLFIIASVLAAALALETTVADALGTRQGDLWHVARVEAAALMTCIFLIGCLAGLMGR